MGLCNHPAQLGATCDSAPAVKRWGSPRRQGLCSHLAHLWAISDSVPCYARFRSTKARGGVPPPIGGVAPPPPPATAPKIVKHAGVTHWPAAAPRGKKPIADAGTHQ